MSTRATPNPKEILDGMGDGVTMPAKLAGRRGWSVLETANVMAAMSNKGQLVRVGTGYRAVVDEDENESTQATTGAPVEPPAGVELPPPVVSVRRKRQGPPPVDPARKANALKRVGEIGVKAAAVELGIGESSLYGWLAERRKARTVASPDPAKRTKITVDLEGAYDAAAAPELTACVNATSASPDPDALDWKVPDAAAPAERTEILTHIDMHGADPETEARIRAVLQAQQPVAAPEGAALKDLIFAAALRAIHEHVPGITNGPKTLFGKFIAEALTKQGSGS